MCSLGLRLNSGTKTFKRDQNQLVGYHFVQFVYKHHGAKVERYGGGGGCHQEIVLAALPEFEYFKEIGNRGFYINLIFK